VGTWGTGLYDNDDASDLRDDFKEMVRAPWDGDRLLGWARVQFPEEGTDVPLALADLFWTYGIDHAGVREDGLRIVADGVDLDAKRALGLDDRGLARRAKLLDSLAEKLQTPNPKPRARRMLAGPEPFVLEEGACLVYPTSQGRVRNPYVSPRKEESFYALHPGAPDGWAAAVVLARKHRFETFARYLIAILRNGGREAARLEDVPALSILHSNTFGRQPLRRVHLVSTARRHLERMRVEVVGRVEVAGARVAEEFAAELRRSGREFANDAWTLPDMYRHDPARLTPADADDPIARFLVQ
jgi:hypothetical protein